MVVLADTNFPGWSATVDGKLVRIYEPYRGAAGGDGGWRGAPDRDGLQAVECAGEGRVVAGRLPDRAGLRSGGTPMILDRRSSSLPEVHASVQTGQPSLWRRMFAFAGPAYLVSVGYMDPGNWATDLEGGARFGYELLWVLVMSNLMAILLQT